MTDGLVRQYRWLGVLYSTFEQGVVVRKHGQVIGRGMTEAQLLQSGYTRRQLRALASRGVLERMTIRQDEEPYDSYVLLQFGAACWQ